MINTRIEYQDGRKRGVENEEIAGEPGTGDDGSHAIAAILKVEEVA